jgi:DNA-binding CsgD family transcriptional regulator
MDVNRLIGEIYESVGNEAALREAISGLAGLAASRGSQFGVVDDAGRYVRSGVVGFSPEALTDYLHDHMASDPRLLYLARHPGRLVADDEMVPEPAAYERSALVAFLNKSDARYAVGAVFPVGSGLSASLAFMRARRDGPYRPDELRRLEPLLPHLRRALTLNVRLSGLESSRTSLTLAWHALDEATFWVDKTGHVLEANRSGASELVRGTFLQERGGTLVPRNARQAAQLAPLVAAALDETLNGSPERQGGSLVLLGPLGERALLTVQALRGAVPGSGADLLLLLKRLDPDSERTWRERLGLTPAEARLALALVAGESTSQLADRWQVSRETLKSQMGALFRKTETHRQAQLVAFLMALGVH